MLYTSLEITRSGPFLRGVIRSFHPLGNVLLIYGFSFPSDILSLWLDRYFMLTHAPRFGKL